MEKKVNVKEVIAKELEEIENERQKNKDLDLCQLRKELSQETERKRILALQGLRRNKSYQVSARKDKSKRAETFGLVGNSVDDGNRTTQIIFNPKMSAATNKKVEDLCFKLKALRKTLVVK